MRITITSPHDVITLDDTSDRQSGVWALKKDGIKGLHGTPNIRESPLDRPQTDGAYWPSRLTQSSRSISLDCIILNASSLAATQARDRINALACQPLTLTVSDVNGERSIDCWLAADPEPLMRRRMDAFEFALLLTCPDPYWQGALLWQSPQSGRVLVDNTGNAPTWLRFEARSRITRLHATWLDADIEWAGNTTALALDTRDMIPSAGQVTADWALPIQPGVTQVAVSTDCTNLRVGFRPAWR